MMKKNQKTIIVEPKQVKAPSILQAETLSSLLKQADWDVKNSQSTLDAFLAKFQADEVNAFEWSKGVFEAAARKRAAKMILSWVEMIKSSGDEYSSPTDLQIVQKIRTALFENVVRGARWPENSTSPMSNEMSRILIAAQTEWLIKVDDKLVDYFSRIETVS